MDLKIKEWLFYFFEVVTICAAFFFACICIPIAIIAPGFFRTLSDKVHRSWIIVLTVLTQTFGPKIYVTGDHMNVDENSIIIMNHRSTLDWSLLTCALVQALGPFFGRNRPNCVAKDTIRHYPISGWIGQLAGFLFLKRGWNFDKQRIAQYLDFHVDLGHTVRMCLFPEGYTLLNSSVMQKSQIYAKERGLPQLFHTLYPKTKGFCFMAKHMLNHKSLDAIYDVTAAHVGRMPLNELEHVIHGSPKEVQFVFKRYPVEELPQTEEGLKEWIQKRWAEKEAMLSNFEETQRLSEEFWEFQMDRWNFGTTVIIWTGFSCAMICLFVFHPVFRIFVLGFSLFFIFLSIFSDGYLNLEMWWYQKWKRLVTRLKRD